MSNKSLLSKTNNNYFNLNSNIAFEISNVKTDNKTKKLKSSFKKGSWCRASNVKSQNYFVLALIPTENQIFRDCLDAHLFEIDYNYSHFYMERQPLILHSVFTTI
jgi:hypothetical protein